MPEDSELRLVNVFGTVPQTATQFEIVPPPTLQRIGTVSSGSDQLTVNSVSGLSAGLYIYGNGIEQGTQIDSILGNVITMTANATSALTRGIVYFYADATDTLLPLSPNARIRFF